MSRVLKAGLSATSHPKPQWASSQQHLFVLVLAQLCMLPQHAFADTIPCQTRIQHAEAILIRFKSTTMSRFWMVLASFPNQLRKSEGGSLIELTSAPCQGIAEHLQVHQLEYARMHSLKMARHGCQMQPDRPNSEQRLLQPQPSVSPKYLTSLPSQDSQVWSLA